MQSNDQTLLYYQQYAMSFVDSTLTADMEDIRAKFMQYLPAGGLILDFGCGSGRDTKAFLSKGYRVEAVDGSSEICRVVFAKTGIPVQQMLFQELNVQEKYHGVWACASILHLPKAELPDVMIRISNALKGEGIFYTSFKYGTFEGRRNGRYFTDFTEDTLTEFMAKIPMLNVMEIWVTGDVRSGREDERWINMLARRVSK